MNRVTAALELGGAAPADELVASEVDHYVVEVGSTCWGREGRYVLEIRFGKVALAHRLVNPPRVCFFC